ncbi:hypothetical protein IKF81_01525 [Candidatus Saccharibacteria bacterium]|nr:hypothetical protein [Candidatus Saccharibacteria bacterium]
MSDYVSLGIVLLSGLLVASLQLPLGTFLLLFHSSMSKNIPKKTKTLASSFISGATIMFFFLLCSACFLISAISFSGTLSIGSLLVILGILIALAIISFLFYYRRKGSTELWLPRKVSRFINSRAKHTSDNSEAFSLGLFVVFAEQIFTLPLVILSANEILKLDKVYQTVAIVIFTLLSVLPLLIMRFIIRKGKNLADIQRWRLKYKNFFRLFSGSGYLILAIFLFAFQILGVNL